MNAGAGFALPGALPLDARQALALLERAAGAGLSPLLLTEVCGYSAPSLAAALAAQRPGVRTGTAIVPLGSRSEPALAMEAATAAQIAGTPFLLGVGTSTRQILQDWHGRTHAADLATTRDRLQALRAILNGERRGSFRLPVPPRDGVRVLLAALGPAMTALGFDEADGVIVNLLPPELVPAPRAGKLVLAFCWVPVSDDGEQRARRDLTSYIMADPYARHFMRLGYGETVEQVRALYAAGRLREAPAALPPQMIAALYTDVPALPDRLAQYRSSGALPIIVPVTGNRPADEITRFLDHRRWSSRPGKPNDP